jgi:hypothetical protein
MFRKSLILSASLLLGAQILGTTPSFAADDGTNSEITADQYEQLRLKYEAKKEVQLAKKLKDLETKEVKKQKSKLSKEIAELSDDQFVRFMHNFVLNNESTVEEMKEKLSQVNVEFSMKEKKEDGLFHAAVLDNPSDIELNIYASKRGGQSYWHLTSSWDALGWEDKHATLDVVSVEWDPEYGAYYSSTVPSDGIVTKRDGSNRLNGIYLFNVDDDKFTFDSYACVQVTKKKSGDLNFGTKYTHTYSTTSTSATGQAGIQWDSTGPTGGFTYSVTSQTNVSKWYKYEDNALTF